jgi:MOSC domain-containing protein YiiM
MTSSAKPVMLEVGLVQVNVAETEVIGQRRGRPVKSAIRKRRVVSEGSVFVAETNIAGDRQADLRVHGGPEKAVYAYPFEHLDLWNAEISPEPPFGPGTFGENLTVTGWRESDVCIGDVWAWGEALLQVCQPRFPCFKLAMATERAGVGRRMLETGRTGWYLRVLRPGEAPVAGPLTVVERGSDAVTVLNAARAMLPASPPELIDRVIGAPALAARWRATLLERLIQGQGASVSS